MTDIGINKTRMGINLAFILIFISLGIICAIMWGMYQANFTNEYWIQNGIEVEAECESYFIRYDENDKHLARFWCRYKYVDNDGKEYYAYGQCSNEQAALNQIGKKIPIVIDPNSTKARRVDLENLKLNYKRDYILAVIFSIPVPIALYLLLYRGIYRSAMNYKIRKKVGLEDNDYIGGNKTNTDAIKTGEVTKVVKWIVCYVKVKYKDESGATREKWARSWFTHKEAKYLQQKKIITIVPYKNTYGILEEMSAK